VSNQRVRLLVSGRVQGVGFRDFVARGAGRLGLSGWVRNLHDGRVEIEAWGDGSALAQLAEMARRGPALAHVTDVSARWDETPGGAMGFEVRRDA
jgi:acylphosphatase